MKIFQRVTVAADILGNQIQNSSGFSAVTSTSCHSQLFRNRLFNNAHPRGVERLNASYTVNDFSIGLKWKPFAKLNFLLYANGLFQMNNVGMRSDPVPLVGASYTFKP